MSRHEYSIDVQHELTAVGWQGLLNEASTPEDVVGVVRDFIALWTPPEVAQLPEALRPHRMVDGEDVNLYALELVRAQHDANASPQLHRMANFFSNASLRLSQILASSSAVSAEGE